MGYGGREGGELIFYHVMKDTVTAYGLSREKGIIIYGIMEDIAQDSWAVK